MPLGLDGFGNLKAIMKLRRSIAYLRQVQLQVSSAHPRKLRLQQERIFSLVASFGSLLFSSMFISACTQFVAVCLLLWYYMSCSSGVSEFHPLFNFQAELSQKMGTFPRQCYEHHGQVGAHVEPWPIRLIV
ncbi:unnamed protein product [Symbiodinium natans]|uniref:Uncharacterized protein n=1 Tax=Symbiodinium natans TaxID=878477 RepID=A0A812IDI5_9DINO|nr:unnamed protein product [Symbiodinium natans]